MYTVKYFYVYYDVRSAIIDNGAYSSHVSGGYNALKGGVTDIWLKIG